MCFEKWVLDELQNKINKIEDDDINYQQNAKWIKYRKHQDDMYNTIRRRKEMEDNNERGL